jgi:DNA-binding SARP family transcriptional activator
VDRAPADAGAALSAGRAARARAAHPACYLFWPDVPDTTARRNLTHLLTLLRRALPHPDLLLINGETVAFHPQRVASDA